MKKREKMKNRIISISNLVAGEGFNVKEVPKEMAEKFPFCIDVSSLVWIDGGYISLIFGKCSKNSLKWHAFLISRWKLQRDHPLDPLYPASSIIQNGIRLVTFEPRDISDEVLARVIEKLKDAKNAGKLQNFLYG